MSPRHALHGIDHLTSIGLGELAERAALQTRIDRKYMIPAAEVPSVLAELDPATRVLEIDGQRGFDYESVYFDTPALDSYLPAAHPRRRRFKVRTRRYLDSGECYLEVKTRGGRGATVKERIPYRAADRELLTHEGLDYVEESLGFAGIEGIDPTELRPVLTTHYTRTTLYLPGTGSRSTIDTGLAWSTGDTSLRLDDSVIVETKSAGQACEVDRILWAHGHRPQGISKFATGMAALRPELPSNRWSRILRRHFEPALAA